MDSMEELEKGLLDANGVLDVIYEKFCEELCTLRSEYFRKAKRDLKSIIISLLTKGFRCVLKISTSCSCTEKAKDCKNKSIR